MTFAPQHDWVFVENLNGEHIYVCNRCKYTCTMRTMRSTNTNAVTKPGPEWDPCKGEKR